ERADDDGDGRGRAGVSERRGDEEGRIWTGWGGCFWRLWWDSWGGARCRCDATEDGAMVADVAVNIDADVDTNAAVKADVTTIAVAGTDVREGAPTGSGRMAWCRGKPEKPREVKRITVVTGTGRV
ncbi:MAG: hypothetical protein Q4C47_02575, partial [Planctomycetia bacterium]|nr:hypothetical protein [Planctomycetia bacterium]